MTIKDYARSLAEQLTAIADLQQKNLRKVAKEMVMETDKRGGGRMITSERLREVLKYDPETGSFTRKIDIGRWKTGSRAGTNGNSDGYCQIMIDGRLYQAHRLAWLYMTGECPKAEIDHINCDRADNRIVNLRQADRFGNTRNTKKRNDNTSGFKGVQWHACGKWRAMIGVNGKKKHLGLFKTKEAAFEAYVAAAKKYHGEFARAE